MIEVTEIYKYFGDTAALDGMSFAVRNGEIYGLLGPNGSGKTTMMRILAGILEPTKGTFAINGEHPDSFTLKRIVGYVPESPVLYESLTPDELFNLVGKIRKIPNSQLKRRVNYYVDAFEIEEYHNQFIGTLSFGTKQKVSLITALVHDPTILILDEAMNGLDPKTARILKELLLEYKQEGRSIVFSTHVLPLAEMLCDRVGVIHRGTLRAEGTVDELKEKVREEDLEEVFLTLTESRDDIASVLRAMKEGV